jgi:hypothetical protein
MVDAQRLRDELSRMRALIRDDPEVKARFDKDGNGAIDGDEWEEVRQLVVQRLEREEAENAERVRLAESARAAGEAAAVESVERTTPGGVAQGIYQGELRRGPSPSGPASSIGELDEVILQQEGGAKQLFGNTFRREYAILSPDGSSIGTIQQRENEMLQDMTNRSWLEVPDLHFDVFDALSGARFVLERREAVARQRMGVMDEKGLMFAYTDWKFHLVWKKYEVCSALDGSKLVVKNQLLHPFTLDILDVMEEPVGAIERGFSGLGGLLTGGNKMRIHVRTGEANPGLRWGLLAAALLTDLAQEDDKTKASGVFGL